MLQTNVQVYLPESYWAYWGESHLLVNHSTLDWISHPLLLFRKELWQAVSGYPPITLGEDRVFYLRLTEHCKLSWFSQPIEPRDRFAIMRGFSPYVHTSIGGGTGELDLESGQITIEPRSITDPVLRIEFERLCAIRDFQLQSRRPREHQIEEPNRSLQYLDDVEPVSVRVGYGSPGRNGNLGYEDREVVVSGACYKQALSLHGPSEICFELHGRFSNFSAEVAINDDVLESDTAANFAVYADDLLVGVATNVRPGDPPRLIDAAIAGARKLTLIVKALRSDCCHSVWLSPCVWSNESRPGS